MRLSMIVGIIATTNACTDEYATPPLGQYCSGITTVSDRQNCWGDCMTGCPDMTCPRGATCYMETRPVSTTGSCIWPGNTKLCCAHITTDAGKPSFGFVNKTVTVAKEAAMATTAVTAALVRVSTTRSCTDYASAQATACAASLNWCTDTTCFGASSDLYDNCKTDPIFGAAATAVKTALESFGCEPK